MVVLRHWHYCYSHTVYVYVCEQRPGGGDSNQQPGHWESAGEPGQGPHQQGHQGQDQQGRQPG